MTTSNSFDKVFSKMDSVFEGMGKGMEAVSNEITNFFTKEFKSELPTKSFHLIWKQGDCVVIQGKSIADAWNRAGYPKAKIAELQGYEELVTGATHE